LRAALLAVTCSAALLPRRHAGVVIGKFVPERNHEHISKSHPHTRPPLLPALLQGFDNGFCQYAAEYRQYAPEWQIAHTLHRLCSNFKAGIWHADHMND
jgi:hypothetical protein